MRSRTLALLAAAFLSTLAARARADVAPPGYVEKCTVEQQAKAGTECLYCRANYRNREHCSASLASYGFTSSCHTRGESVWGEIWCRSATAPGKKVVPPDVLGQLSDPVNGLRPTSTAAPEATAAPAAPDPTATPLAPASAAPAAPPLAGPVPADTNAPQPQPVPPPPAGCACTVGGGDAGPAAVLLPVIAAAVLAFARRRRRGLRT